MKYVMIFIGMLLGFQPILPAQVSLERHLLGSAGGHAQSGSLELSASLGEVAVEYRISGSLSLSQGFQQGYPSGQTGLETPAIQLEYEIFPNPTDGPLFVKLKATQTLNLRLEVFDLTGKAVGISSPVIRVNGQQSSQQLDLSRLSAGTYVLHLLQEGKSLRAFRVQRK